MPAVLSLSLSLAVKCEQWTTYGTYWRRLAELKAEAVWHYTFHTDTKTNPINYTTVYNTRCPHTTKRSPVSTLLGTARTPQHGGQWGHFFTDLVKPGACSTCFPTVCVCVDTRYFWLIPWEKTSKWLLVRQYQKYNLRGKKQNWTPRIYLYTCSWGKGRKKKNRIRPHVYIYTRVLEVQLT